jgi:hypothetical protein
MIFSFVVAGVQADIGQAARLAPRRLPITMLDIAMLTQAAGTEHRIQPLYDLPRRLPLPSSKLGSMQTGVGEAAGVAPRKHPVTMRDTGICDRSLAYPSDDHRPGPFR